MLWDAQNVIGRWKQTDRAAVGFVCLSPAHSVEWRAVMGQLKFLSFSLLPFFFFFFLAKWLRLNLCELNVDIVQPLYSALLVSTGTAPVPRQALILPRLSHFRRSLWEAVLKPGHPPSVPHICCRAILLKNSRFKHCSTRTRGSPPQRSPPTFCCGRGSVT